jgi:hypothetical protein
MKKQKLTNVLAGLIATVPLAAIDLEKMEIYGYGTLLYSQYDYLPNYQQSPKNRAKVDFERFIISPRFIISDNLKLVSEIEFEHGGVGATMEYDTLEEFGEFESEIESGGEVIVEEAYLDITYQSWLNFKIGHMVIPIGLNSQRHLPNLYLSTHRNISETTILPDTWHETGVMAYGTIAKNLNYQAMIMTGLNSEYFDSANWIKWGNQKSFDYGDTTRSHIGASIYFGNTGANRTKEQLDSDGSVTLMELHGVYDEDNIRLRGLFLWGELSDSPAITTANSGLPNALEAKRTPVASEALAWFVEAGYNIAPILGHQKAIIPFVKYDFVDSMYKTQDGVQDLARYENTITTVGVNYYFNENVAFKLDYSRNVNGDSSIEDMDSVTLSVGYQF